MQKKEDKIKIQHHQQVIVIIKIKKIIIIMDIMDTIQIIIIKKLAQFKFHIKFQLIDNI